MNNGNNTEEVHGLGRQGNLSASGMAWSIRFEEERPQPADEQGDRT